MRILKARPVSLGKETQVIGPSSMAGKSNLDGRAMIIGCGNDALAVEELQQAGKTAMAANDFLHGAGLSIGDPLDPNSRKNRL